MWVIFLSLLACNPEKGLEEDPIDPAHDPTVEEASHKKKRAAPAAGQMATRVADRVAASRPKPKPAGPTKGELVQTDCYGGSDFGVRRSRPRPTSARPGANRGSRGPAKSVPQGAPPMLAGSSRDAMPAEVPAAAPPPPPSRELQAAVSSGGAGEGSIAPAAEPAPMDGAAPMSPPRRKAEEAEKRAAVDDMVAEEADNEWGRPYTKPDPKPIEPSLDWGATVYLSNDDSMSLASAQRLLWAVDQGRGFSPSEVRPHELLNYFSFDTAPVGKGETFSVLGGAEKDGDTLSVALAVQGVMPEREPLDLTLVIDRSGSMRAEGRMDYVKKGLTKMTEQLVDGDRIDLVLFDSSVCSPLQGFVVGRDDASILTEEIQRMQPRGSTDLDGGLREGYRIQTARDAADVHGRNRRVLLLTDAMLNTGNVNEALVSEIGKRFEGDGIRVTGVGVGRDFNDTMLDKITEKGKGAYVYLGSEAVVDRVFGSGFDSLVQTIAHDVQFSIELPDSLAMERFYGEESSTNAEDVQPINYYAGTSQVFLQDLRMKEGGVDHKAEIVFRAKFRDAVTGEPEEETFRTTVGALLDGDTHNLDKAQALMAWTDLLAERAMGDRSCSTLRDYRRAASQVQGDAEIAYVSSLTGRMCGVDMSETVAATGVTYKVKVDADMPIPEVKLACSGETWRDELSGSDKVARFEGVLPGTCRLTLQGNVPMVASVDVPETGGDVRCMVRGGRMSCN